MPHSVFDLHVFVLLLEAKHAAKCEKKLFENSLMIIKELSACVCVCVYAIGLIQINRLCSSTL